MWLFCLDAQYNTFSVSCRFKNNNVLSFILYMFVLHTATVSCRFIKSVWSFLICVKTALKVFSFLSDTFPFWFLCTKMYSAFWIFAFSPWRRFCVLFQHCLCCLFAVDINVRLMPYAFLCKPKPCVGTVSSSIDSTFLRSKITEMPNNTMH